jgi:hypothetical protein
MFTAALVITTKWSLFISQASSTTASAAQDLWLPTAQREF